MIYFFAVYLIWIQIILLIFVWRDAIKALLAGVLSRFVLVEIIRFFYHRPRPFMVNGTEPLFIDDNWAFPSGHASFMFAVATMVFMKNKKLGVVMYILAILTGIGRVMAGVHWPSDIFGGAVLGIFVGWLCNWLFLKYKSNKNGGAAGRSRTDMP